MSNEMCRKSLYKRIQALLMPFKGLVSRLFLLVFITKTHNARVHYPNEKVVEINYCKIKDEIMEHIVTLCLELTLLKVQISQRSMDYFCENITPKLRVTLCLYESSVIDYIKIKNLKLNGLYYQCLQRQSAFWVEL